MYIHVLEAVGWHCTCVMCCVMCVLPLSLSHTHMHMHIRTYTHTYPQLVCTEYMTLTIQLQSSEHSSPTAAVGITTQQPDNNVDMLTSTEAL